ncbi:MAG: AMP-binding protein [Ignavibacteriaceae bacterium]|nr:AMP-binding protein [Ignavibacteriaceae bacterium]
MTLKSMIEESCKKFANNAALSFADSEPINYESLKVQIEDLVKFLKLRGIVHGDRVAILSENSPNWGIAYFAITSMGAIAVPILTEFHSSEIHHILQHAEAKAIFVSERLYPKIEDLSSNLIKDIILIDDFSLIDPNTSKDLLKTILQDGSKELQKIKNMVLKFSGLVSDEVKPDDVASIIYTSGTTGHSKGVMLTHKNIISDAVATLKFVKYTSTDRSISLLPLAHVYECTLGLVIPIMVGANVNYLRKPPTAAVLLPALEKIKPTLILSVPLIIEKMYKARILPEIQKKKLVKLAYKVPSLRKKINKVAGKKLMKTFGGKLELFCIGGAALSPEVELFLKEAGFPYAIGYGLTETSPLIAGTNQHNTKLLSTGPAVPGIELKIENPDPKNGEGEILVRGDVVMKGYYKDPEKTKEVIDKDGWFRTGDLGCFDKDNYLYIKGRVKNMILGPSGENIYPEIIESVVNRSEYVLESLVCKKENQLTALVFLNYEKIDEDFQTNNKSQSEQKVIVADILKTIKENVNNSVSSFSRVGRVLEQLEPFEKTPTQKIKRYLYIN